MALECTANDLVTVLGTQQHLLNSKIRQDHPRLVVDTTQLTPQQRQDLDAAIRALVRKRALTPLLEAHLIHSPVEPPPRARRSP